VVFLLPAGMMAVALLPLPYGYYQVLRLVACGCAVVGAMHLWRHSEGLAVALGLVAIIFNPIFPVYFDRSVWSVLNVAALVVFVTGWVVTKRSYQATGVGSDVLDPQGRG
jgi:FtsH-binding integral membrane protein